MKHNFPKSDQIENKHILLSKRPTKAQQLEIFQACLAQNLDFNGVNPEFPHMGYDIEENKVTAFSEPLSSNTLKIEFKEFIAYLKGKGSCIKIPVVIKIQLNGEYTAKVTKDSITVGCQEFTHKAIEELYHASKKVLKS